MTNIGFILSPFLMYFKVFFFSAKLAESNLVIICNLILCGCFFNTYVYGSLCACIKMDFQFENINVFCLHKGVMNS